MSRPDFLIVGAMKCGTSTLAAQLKGQGGVFLTTPKEPNYFSDDDVYHQGPDWYASLFEDAGPEDLKGEASTHYTKLPTYPDTIARAKDVLENPRIIYLIRNPVERAVSHFTHELSFAKMPSDIEAAFADHAELFDYGHYPMQIAPWIEAYGADAVKVISLEAMHADPQGTLEQVARFIGHDGPVRWIEAEAQQNASADRIRRFPLHGLLIDNSVAQILRRTLVPKSVRTWVRDKRLMDKRPELHATLREALEARFAEDCAKLLSMFPDCPDIALSYPFVTAQQKAS